MLDTVTNDFPILSLMIVSLPVAALLIWLTPDPMRARWIALTAALFDLVLSLIAVAQFNPANSGFQLVERHSWIPTLNVDYLIGVDGISILFLPLTVLLFIGVILASWNTTRTLPRLYFMLLMVLESSVIGIFCALDTMLFFLFWELTLIPTYFLISLWGVGPNRRYAAVKYTLFMMATGVPMLFGFLVLAFNHTGASGLVFDYQTLLATPLPAELQTAVFFLLLVGFAAKAGVVPFHSWLPTVAMEGPAAITAIMVGLKLGLYGLIRFTIPLAPEAAHEFHWLLAGLGISGVIYGAILALAQSNLRRMLAFSSISHAGLVVLGIASLEIIGLQGALFQLLNFVVVAGGIFLLTGYLHQRIGSTDYASLGGVAKSMPLLAAFYFLFGIAGMGVPGTNGFAAEHAILISVLEAHTGTGLAALFGLILGAGYFLAIYRQAFLGPVQSTVVADSLDLKRRELTIMMVMALLIIGAGLYPNGVYDLTRSASEAWVSGVTLQAGS